MISFMVYSWHGQLKWAEIMGCYFVDPAYVREFKAAMPDSHQLPLNANFI